MTPRPSRDRAVRAALALAAALLSSGAGTAAEVTLQMRGGDFSIKGDLRSYDGAKYVIESKSFGSMSLDASRFECLGKDCPKAPVAVPAAQSGGVLGQLGSTVWMGGSAQGTSVFPKMIQSYANSIGAQVTRVVGADAKNLEFKLSRPDGQELGVFHVHRQGVPAGLEGLEKRTVDVTWSARPITLEEQARMQKSGLGNMRAAGNEHVYALNAIVAIVAPENPAVSISIDNLARIYSGEITDWSQLGLPAGKINVYAMVETSGVWGSFEDLVMKPRQLKARPDITRIDASNDWSDVVARDKAGIGITNVGIVRNSKALNVEATCGLITRPSNFTAKTEEYPLMHRLHLYTPGQPRTALGRELLAFAMSPRMQPVLKEANFVDQEPEALEFTAQTSRIAYALNAQSEDFNMEMMRTLITELKGASRLSITFRFANADANLDNRSLADVARLRDLLLSPEYKSKKVTLLGFADAVGPFPANLKLAERRSAQVLRALTAAGGAPLRSQIMTRAYGELAPVACNDSPDARAKNRRVEVWVRD